MSVISEAHNHLLRKDWIFRELLHRELNRNKIWINMIPFEDFSDRIEISRILEALQRKVNIDRQHTLPGLLPWRA